MESKPSYFFTLCHFGPYSGWRKNYRKSISSSHQARGQSSLWNQVYFQLSTQHLSFKFCILTYIGCNHFFDLLILQQQAQTEIIHPSIVTDASEVCDPLIQQSRNKVFRNPTQPKTT